MNDGARRMLEGITFLRQEVSKDITPRLIELFLYIGSNEGVTQHKLAKAFSLNHGTVSRNIRFLSRYYQTKDGKTTLEGYDLVQTTPDLHHRRRMACFLTKRGKSVMAELRAIMDEEATGRKR